MSGLANKLFIEINIKSEFSFTELILNHSNSLYLEAGKFWTDNDSSFTTALQMCLGRSWWQNSFSTKHWITGTGDRMRPFSQELHGLELTRQDVSFTPKLIVKYHHICLYPSLAGYICSTLKENMIILEKGYCTTQKQAGNDTVKNSSFLVHGGQGFLSWPIRAFTSSPVTGKQVVSEGEPYFFSLLVVFSVGKAFWT